MISAALTILRTEDERLELSKFYTLYSKRLYAIAYSKLHNRLDAEDAVQETFARIAKNPEKFFSLEDNKRLAYRLKLVYRPLLGGLIGVAFGITAAKVTTIFTEWPTIITVSSLVISFFVCAVTGIFFGWYPAKKAANLDPIVALRYE